MDSLIFYFRNDDDVIRDCCCGIFCGLSSLQTEEEFNEFIDNCSGEYNAKNFRENERYEEFTRSFNWFKELNQLMINGDDWQREDRMLEYLNTKILAYAGSLDCLECRTAFAKSFARYMSDPSFEYTDLLVWFEQASEVYAKSVFQGYDLMAHDICCDNLVVCFDKRLRSDMEKNDEFFMFLFSDIIKKLNDHIGRWIQHHSGRSMYSAMNMLTEKIRFFMCFYFKDWANIDFDGLNYREIDLNMRDGWPAFKKWCLQFREDNYKDDIYKEDKPHQPPVQPVTQVSRPVVDRTLFGCGVSPLWGGARENKRKREEDVKRQEDDDSEVYADLEF